MTILNSGENAVITREILFNEVIVIKKFMQAKQVNDILEKLKLTYDCTLNQFVPYKFPEIDWNNTGEFKNMVRHFNSALGDLLVTPFIASLNSYLSGFSIMPVSGLEEDPLFSTLTARVLQPNKVEIHHHCENEMVPRCPPFYDLLGKYINVWDQHSMVLMLNKPTTGGEIVIYDEKWKDASVTDTQRNSLEDLDKRGEAPLYSVRLDPGDLLIFRAGNTWHKVAEVFGSEPRITAGCFMGASVHEPNNMLCWS